MEVLFFSWKPRCGKSQFRGGPLCSGAVVSEQRTTALGALPDRKRSSRALLGRGLGCLGAGAEACAGPRMRFSTCREGSTPETFHRNTFSKQPAFPTKEKNPCRIAHTSRMLLHNHACRGPRAQKTLNLEVRAETSMSASSPSLSAALGPELGAHVHEASSLGPAFSKPPPFPSTGPGVSKPSRKQPTNPSPRCWQPPSDTGRKLMRGLDTSGTNHLGLWHLCLQPDGWPALCACCSPMTKTPMASQHPGHRDVMCWVKDKHEPAGSFNRVPGPAWALDCFKMSQKNSLSHQHLEPPEKQQPVPTSALATTGLKKISFHSNPKEQQCQRMFKLMYNHTHLTH